MTVALQIRDVPEDVRDAIAEIAASRGQSMQAYLLEMVGREAQLLRNMKEFERLAPYRAKVPVADEIVAIIREGRDGGFDIDRDDYE
jgi:hypothetical protein